MRRTTAAEDRTDHPTALIDGDSGAYDPGYGAEPPPASPAEAVGRHRLSTRPAGRNTASGDAPTDALPHMPAVGSRHAVAARRTTLRRLAPVGVCAAVTLVAAVVVAVIPQNRSSTGPQLADAARTPTPTASASPDPSPSAATPAPASAGPTAAATGSSTRTRRPATVAGGVVPPRAVAVPTTGPAAGPSARPPVSTSDGTQAATRFGWKLVASDEFSGTALSDDWGPYEGAGNSGKGRRTADAISLSGGVLTIKGDADGTTGGMAWNTNQTHGRWEVRARFPRGDDQYHPVLLLWPDNGWPPEVDFSETTSASSDTSFYLHYSSSNQQVSASKNLDLTQWHDYAVEWESGHVTGYVDGVQWFQSTDGKTIPHVPMHLAIQLDYFPDGGSPRPSELDVDYVRIYQ